MDLSKLKAALAAILLTVAPLTAQATPLAPGVYNAMGQKWLSEPDIRSIWTNPNKKIVSGGTASNLWAFINTTFNFSGSIAILEGSAENTKDSNLTFDFKLTFNNGRTGPILNTGYCQFPNPGSTNVCDSTDVDAIDGTNGDWTYLDLVGGSFKGTGAVMGGLEYMITDKSGHPPQAGLEANALNHNKKDGFSMWFHWKKIAGPTTASSVYTFHDKGNGDINTNLEQIPGIPPIPLPAAAWLLIGALGALGGLGMRRRKA